MRVVSSASKNESSPVQQRRGGEGGSQAEQEKVVINLGTFEGDNRLPRTFPPPPPGCCLLSIHPLLKMTTPADLAADPFYVRY